MGRLDGKVAIVTGGARGSGRAIAARFVAEGARVVIADLREAEGAATADALGERACFRSCDVTAEDDWAELVAFTGREVGPLTTLVNNAAVLLLADIADTSVDEYLRVMRVNELGPFLGIKAVTAAMSANGGGSIVNISSIDGVYVVAGTAAYSASKFAVRGLTKVAALELGPLGIRVNAVCPAAGNAEMVAEALPPAIREAMAAARAARAEGGGGGRTPPVGRHGTVEDVASAALFFASDDSGYCTGTDLVLDGGESIGMHIRMPSAGR